MSPLIFREGKLFSGFTVMMFCMRTEPAFMWVKNPKTMSVMLKSG
jgi:hypothetical protein